VLAAGRISSYGTGFHIGGPIKGGFDPVFAGFSQHLSCCITDGEIIDGDLFLGGDNFFGDNFLFFCHVIPPFLERLI
jgi:hypothetical protein